MKSPDEFVVPSWRDRLKVLSVFSLALLWAQSHDYWLASLLERLSPSDTACGAFKQAQLGALYIVTMLLAVAAWFTWLGARIFWARQTPTPNEWLLIKRRVRRGPAALIIGGAYVLAALGTIAFSGHVAHDLQVWGLLDRASPCTGLCG